MSEVSRRDLFRVMLGRQKPKAECTSTPPPELENQVALILDRFCLAYQGSFCSVCSEHCPEEGAIKVERGKPSIIPDHCTGCNKCHDVCPAPKNAVFMVATKPRPGMIGGNAAEPTDKQS